MQTQGWGYGEQILLSEGDVRVTTARLVVGTATYPMQGITSVRLQVQPARVGPVAVAATISVFCLYAVFTGRGGSAAVVPGFVGMAALCLAVYAGFTHRAKYIVMVGTSGVDRQGLATTDGAHAHRVLAALNDALMRR